MGGIAKGVGMIEPHLATMFCFVATDAVVARGALDGVVRRAVDRSFNRVTVDSRPVHQRHGGRPGQRPGRERAGRGRAAAACGSSPPALEALMARLARMLVADGEGATKLVTITVRGAASRRTRCAAARSVANSPAGQDRHQRARTPTGAGS